MSLFSCYNFYSLLDQLPEVTRRNPQDILDGWVWGNIEIYPQFDQRGYYSKVFYLLQQATVEKGWSFDIVSPLPYPPKNYFVSVYVLVDGKRTNEAMGTATDLCLALLVAYVEALKLAGIIK